MLSVYVKKVRRELLAVLKHFDAMAWEAICKLDESEQVAAISKHPAIRECISYHLLSQAGFGPESYVEHRRTRSVYIVSYAIISTDPEGNPFHVVLYGKPESAPVTSSPGVIGRLEEFVSMTTGLNVLPGDLFNQMPRR